MRIHSSSGPPALVLGGYLTVLGTLRCLGKAGIPRHCLTHPESYVRASRHHQGPPQRSEPVNAPTELTGYLEQLPLEAGVLIPCSDEWAMACAGLSDRLRERFPYSGPDEAELNALLDKSRLEDRLQRLGIPRPRTRRVSTEADLGWLSSNSSATWFLKPTDSQTYRRRFGRKALRVDTLEEAVAHLEECNAFGHSMLLQEYIPGPANRHYLVDGFVDREGELRAILARRRMRMYPRDFGDSSYIVGVELEEVAPAAEACRSLLTDGAFRGIFSAEFKNDPLDDQFRLIEVNARPWAYVQFAQSCGFNAPAMAYRDALGIPQEPVDIQSAGARFQIQPNDLKAALAARRTGELGIRQWLAESSGAESALWRVDDPMPAVIELGNALKAVLRQKLGMPGR